MTVIHLDLDTLANDLEKQKEISDAIADDMKSYFNDLEEYSIDIDCPWAQYVEFGSDPADPANATQLMPDPKDPNGPWVTEVKLRIRDWAQSKFQLNDEDRIKRGDKIYTQIMEEGMRAAPFIRPAEYYVTEDLMANPDKYLIEDQNPIELICMEMAAQMAFQIETNHSIDSGGLLRSIRVVKTSEVADVEDPEDLKQIPEYIWNDRSLDRHGNKVKR